jgi:eukaryotic-like serine/threonine-protein kinase
MQDFPVTHAQFELFDPKHATEHSGGSPHPAGDAAHEHPVVNATWFQAWCFAHWVGRIEVEGEMYRIQLPTEAQWEYACRAGTQTPHHFKTIDATVCNYGSKIDTTTAKGKYPPNGWDLYDMHGNVWEWCQDWYASNYYEKSRLLNPRGPRSASARVLRGGSWLNLAWNCRSAFRYGREPAIRFHDRGFRLAAVPWLEPS